MFIKSSFALQALRSSLQDFVHPPFQTKLQELLDRPSLTTGLESNKVMADIRGLIAELQEVRPESIGVSCRSKESFTDYLKGIVEDFTSEEWEWWPLKPRRRPILAGQARLQWRCVSYHDSLVIS